MNRYLVLDQEGQIWDDMYLADYDLISEAVDLALARATREKTIAIVDTNTRAEIVWYGWQDSLGNFPSGMRFGIYFDGFSSLEDAVEFRLKYLNAKNHIDDETMRAILTGSK